LGHAERDIFVVRNMLRVHHKLNQICLLYVNRKHLASLANADDAIGSQVANRGEDKLVRDALSVD
jgi:hypothetical protein